MMKKSRKPLYAGIMTSILGLVLFNGAFVYADDGTSLFAEGRDCFYSALKYQFERHPLRFRLGPAAAEGVESITTASPYLYENVIHALYWAEAPYIPALADDSEETRVNPEFREYFMNLCREAAREVVCSLFQPESSMGGKAPAGISRIASVLQSIGHDHSGSDAETKTNHPVKTRSYDWAFHASRFFEAHQKSRGKGIRIAVIESRPRDGVEPAEYGDISFPLTRMSGSPIPPWLIRDREKAGTDTAKSLMGRLVKIIAPEAEIRTYRIFDEANPLYPYWTAFNTAAAIRRAVLDGADILAVGPEFDRDYPFLRKACRFAYDRNVFLVCPAGKRSGLKPDQPAHFPAHYNTTYAAVAAEWQMSGKIRPIENSEQSCFVSASVPVPYFPESGDMRRAAASWAAGLAGLMAERLPKTGNQLDGQYVQWMFELMNSSARPEKLGLRSFDLRGGYGLLDAADAVGDKLEAFKNKAEQIEASFRKRLEERFETEEEKTEKNKEK